MPDPLRPLSPPSVRCRSYWTEIGLNVLATIAVTLSIGIATGAVVEACIELHYPDHSRAPDTATHIPPCAIEPNATGCWWIAAPLAETFPCQSPRGYQYILDRMSAPNPAARSRARQELALFATCLYTQANVFSPTSAGPLDYAYPDPP